MEFTREMQSKCLGMMWILTFFAVLETNRRVNGDSTSIFTTWTKSSGIPHQGSETRSKDKTVNEQGILSIWI